MSATKTAQPKPLTWQDSRWHCDGRPIHAGDAMELRGDGGNWIPIRVESADRGYRLTACVVLHGVQFCYGIDTEYDRLRWS